MLSKRFLLGLCCLICSIAIAALLYIIAASLSTSTDRLQFALMLASAVLSTLHCFTSAAIVYQCRVLASGKLTPSTTRSRKALLIIGILPWLVATALTAAAVGILATHRSYEYFNRPLSVATLVVWITSWILHALFYAAMFHAPELSNKFVLNSEKPISATNTTSGSETPKTHTSNPFKDKSPSMTAPSPHGPSGRSSFSTITRPASSVRNFSVRSLSQPRQSGRESIDGPSTAPSSRPSQEGGFDTWDTSEVSAQIRETVINSKLSRSAQLPTIPGSRSPSPAKVLEGPFFDPSPDHTPPQSPLPQPSVSQTTSPVSPHSPVFTTTIPPLPPSPIVAATSSPLMTNSPRLSRPPSLIRRQSGEEHIHPLFRCSSPGPTPSASPTTVVTAAPEAGEVIDRRMLNRIRSVSVRSSSQPPTERRSDSFGSARSLRAPQSHNTLLANQALPARAKPSHHRKRSASFEGCIMNDEIAQ